MLYKVIPNAVNCTLSLAKLLRFLHFPKIRQLNLRPLHPSPFHSYLALSFQHHKASRA